MMIRAYDNIIVTGDMVSNDGGETFKKKVIGVNFAHGYIFSGSLSSFDSTFVDEIIAIGNDYNCVIGDITEAYKILNEKTEINNPQTLNEKCCIVYETCTAFFGGIEHTDERLNNYKSIAGLNCDGIPGKISGLQGKSSAMCVERAALSQNLLQRLGIKSVYKSSGILKSGVKEIHAYNLIEYDNRYYIFDASIPSIINQEITPLIAEISKEIFEMISAPLPRVGYSVHVNHYNPVRDEQVDIIYDSGRSEMLYVETSGDLKSR